MQKKQLLIILALILTIAVAVQLVLVIHSGALEERNKPNYAVEVFEYDGCEYLFFPQPAYARKQFGYAHKGNCKHCQKRLEELVREILTEKAEAELGE